jgi:ribonuclease D
MKIIKETDELAAICRRLAEQPFVCIDTEFMREGTFWPELCLIQLAGGGEEAIVDPLAGKLELAPFFELMREPNLIKVFHAGRQDIEIIHYLSGDIPEQVFDTQIAAMVCGFGDQVGYADLIQKLLNVQIDKSSRFSDWRRRPLDRHQLEYALADVTYLAKAYPLLRQDIEEAGRMGWLAEELSAIVDPRLYQQHPEEAWQRLKVRTVKHSHLGILIELAHWREVTAQQRNLPRNRIVKDDVLYEVANQAPRSEEELLRLRSVTKGMAQSSYGAEMLKAVERGLALKKDRLPKIKREPRLSNEALAAVELMRVLLKAVAAEHNVAPRIIAASEELERIAVDDDADVPALKGWRRDLFGSLALALKRGEICLTLRNGNIAAVPAPVRADAEQRG